MLDLARKELYNIITINIKELYQCKIVLIVGITKLITQNVRQLFTDTTRVIARNVKS